MIRKGIRPIVSSVKNGLLLKNIQSKYQHQFITQTNHCSYHGLIKTVNYQFSQQQTNDPNEQLKRESKEFYEKYVNDIIELQKSQDWPMVIGNTAEPLIIDFYADWCGPCKKLTPILEERVKRAQGKIKLLKVNIDKCGQVANQLRITSVPTVYAVFRGQGIDSFQGLPQQSKINQLFETLEKVVSISDKQDKIYEYLTEGKNFLSKGEYEKAEKCFLQINEKGADEQLLALKQVLLAQCYLSQLKIAKFKDQVVKMKKYEQYYLSNSELKDFYELIIREEDKINEMSNEVPEIAQLKSKVSSSPNDLSARFQLAEVYKQNQMMEESLNELLEIIRIDKNWEDKKANKYMLALFKELGNASPLTQKYRKLMQRLLY